MRRGTLRLLGVVALAAWLAGCNESEDLSLDNPFDPRNGLDLPVPDSIVVTVGSNVVRLQWGLGGAQADEFAVFGRRMDGASGPEDERLLARVGERKYQDSSARNGRTYQYRIAAGVNRRFGRRSEPVEARPGAFSLVLADDTPRTRTRTLQVSLVAPGAEVVQLSESTDSLTGAWRRFSPVLSWTLSDGDGLKTAYAVFQLQDGSQTTPVSDDIILDTRAVIRSVDFEGSGVRQPGNVIRFRLDAGETSGRATVDVAGLFTSLPLFDDGTNGDRTSRDGIYERETAIPAVRNVDAAGVTGNFTDEVGNTATPLLGLRTLSVVQSPDAVSLLEPLLAEPPDAAMVTLRWTQSQQTDFAAYHIFRSLAAPVDSSDVRVGSVTTRTSLDFNDTDVIESEEYFYKVYVATTSGLLRGSNPRSLIVPNLRPPSSVTMQQPVASSTTSLALRWTASGDGDFRAYRLYRNTSGVVSDADTMVATDLDRNYFDDRGLLENRTYHYRVYVVDLGNLSTPSSNEVEATTRNEVPPAVLLAQASAVDSTAATLSWGQSLAHDFASYRLFRDETPTVTESSHLVVEIEERSALGFRDTTLRPSTLYYYRVFVVDDGTNPGPKSAGSNTVSLHTVDSTGTF
jgi:hypothetical protein